MANKGLKGLTSVEALNSSNLAAADSWTVNTGVTWASSDSDDTATTAHYDVSGNSMIAVDINTYFLISFNAIGETADAGNIDKSTDFVLGRGTYFLKVPKGIGKTIYFNALPFADNGGSGGDSRVATIRLRVVQL